MPSIITARDQIFHSLSSFETKNGCVLLPLRRRTDPRRLERWRARHHRRLQQEVRVLLLRACVCVPWLDPSARSFNVRFCFYTVEYLTAVQHLNVA